MKEKLPVGNFLLCFYVVCFDKYNMDRRYETKYEKWYWNLMDLARTRVVPSGYVEKHHIKPRSFGGSNSKSNLVALTAREHYIAHLLLTKIVYGPDRYKMIRALVRFIKTSNRSYALARKIIAKESLGYKNPSFGKRWAYEPKTLKITYCQKSEVPEGYVFGLPYQRGGHSGYVWANNGFVETMMKKVDIETPWKEGRLFKPLFEQSRCASKSRHTAGKDKEHSEKIKGRIQLFNPNTGRTKRVTLNDLNSYMSEGWIHKSVPTKFSKQCSVNGTIYFTIAEACETLNISHATLTKRLRDPTMNNWKYLP